MSRLSKQSIRALCQGPAPMITPFEPSKVRVNGVSKGLSHASYDASIAHDLVLGRHPGVVIAAWAKREFTHLDPDERFPPNRWYHWLRLVNNTVKAVDKLVRAFGRLARDLHEEPCWYSLAYTVEDFHMPPDVGGDVADKSTHARVFVSAFNTFFDPGFHGNATLELVNHSDSRVTYKAGQGVCQFIFTWLDEATEDPYAGKYQHQVKGEGAARYEADTRTPVEIAESIDRKVDALPDADSHPSGKTPEELLIGRTMAMERLQGVAEARAAMRERQAVLDMARWGTLPPDVCDKLSR